MAKSNEKGPLLFVDTTYKGCVVTEQSFFKTPTQKPKDIVAKNYVHNFDHLEESSFQSLVPNKVTNESDVYEECDVVTDVCPYETVNIMVNYYQDAKEMPTMSHQTDTGSAEAEVQEVVCVEEETLDDEVEKEATVESDLVEVSEENSCELIEETVEVDEVLEQDEELDEKQQEILTFIQGLTHRPMFMKAPIVQIVTKDGTQKSGMIELKDEQHITIDNLMDDIEVIPVKEIEGIRILHL